MCIFEVRGRMTAKRNTIQKTLVLRALNELKSHPTVDEIYQAVKLQYPLIAKVTVYRILKQLDEDGVVKRIEIPGEADHYDHITAPHYHVRCVSCTKVDDVDLNAVSDLKDSVSDPHGYLLTGFDLVFKGLCPKCRRKMSLKSSAAAN